MTLTTRKMSTRHETHLAEVLDGRMTRGSGNQWRDQMDGKHEADQPWAYAWDGKSTLGKSVSITREMWKKAVEQARPCLPAIPLRFYLDDRLTKVSIDLICIRLSEFAVMRSEAVLLSRIREQGCLQGNHARVAGVCTVCEEGL